MAIRAVDLPDGLLHLAVFHDVTTLVRSARTDWLTSLPNRRSTEEVLAREWERLRRRSGAFALSRGELTDARPVTPLSVVMIDIDDFSVFNDNHGHHTGDEMLRRTSLVLRAALRSCDLVGRWGGEEFPFLSSNASFKTSSRCSTGINCISLRIFSGSSSRSCILRFGSSTVFTP